jgi:hypothetical protein
MKDNKVAKLLLSVVTNLNIIELEFLPQELSHLKSEGESKSTIYSALNLSIYRLDFSAKIKEDNGKEKVIIIEVQKSKFTNESLRFRKYLGKQYMNESFFHWVEEANEVNCKYGIPILPIYFLGETFSGFEEYPVLHIDKVVKDRFNSKVLSQESKFIDSLFHEGIIINIPALRKKRRSELEILLSIFDQENRAENHHIMNVKETDFPEKFRPIIRRLQGAIQEKDVRNIMIVEDDFLSELNDYENRIADERKQKEEERKLKEEERKLKEEEQKLKEEERKLKEEALAKQYKAIKLLLKLGMSADEIAAQLNLPLEKIKSENDD